MDLYIPILGLGLLAALFAVGSVVASSMLGPKRYNRAKLDSYECGIQPTPQPVGGGKFPVKYYITAMLFIVFDIEIIFLYPWAVAFDQMALFGLVEMVIFIVTVFVAYAYVWRRGAPVVIISIAQHARPNVAGHRDALRKYPASPSTVLSRTPEGSFSSKPMVFAPLL